ncbi:MAG: ribosome maturation factor RimP [Longispora sp.]|nr:ribosome maturation factor RimP [Longispora sp. (in: high G+C Gram-positive bacteria)]
MASLAVLKTRMTEIVAPAVTGAGFDLEDLTVNRVGRRLLIRITVDGDNGVSLDEVAAISRRIAEELDAVDGQLGPEPYTLEVSSPGVDRPLTEERHWRRATGRLVKSTAGTGRVIAVTGGVVTLEIDGQQREMPVEELGSGKIQVEFNRPGADLPDDVNDVDVDDFAELDAAEHEDNAGLASEKRDHR